MTTDWFLGTKRRGRLEQGVQIVGTIGPACRDEEKLYQLMLAGLDVVRLHSAYAGHSEHRENVQRIRKAATRAGIYVPILQDLAGAKLRVEIPRNQSLSLRPGQNFTLGLRTQKRTSADASVQHPELMRVVQEGDLILLADGAMRVRATECSERYIVCQVEQGGVLKPHQAVHVPEREIPIPVPTPQDYRDLEFGLEQGVDWVAQSFLTKASQIHELRDWMRKRGRVLPIIAKIERKAAFENLISILLASDGVMVARGDLGLDYPIEVITLLQKEIIRCANALHKPVITATEMLASMMENSTPTRAEVADITNAVLDGTNAVMLSGETGVGRFPVEAVQTASRIIRSLEPAQRAGLARSIHLRAWPSTDS